MSKIQFGPSQRRIHKFYKVEALFILIQSIKYTFENNIVLLCMCIISVGHLVKNINYYYIILIKNKIINSFVEAQAYTRIHCIRRWSLWSIFFNFSCKGTLLVFVVIYLKAHACPSFLARETSHFFDFFFLLLHSMRRSFFLT